VGRIDAAFHVVLVKPGVFLTHWPSRSGGQFESEGYRATGRGDVGLLPPARPRSPWVQTPVLAIGGLHRRIVRHFAGSGCVRYPGRAASVESDAAGRPARPTAASLSTTSLTRSISTWSTRTRQTPSHDQSRCLPEANPLRRNGQAGQLGRILRPFPNHP